MSAAASQAVAFGQFLQRPGQGRGNDGNGSPFGQQAADLAFGDGTAAEDQTGLAVEIEVDWIHKRNSLSKLYVSYYTIITEKSCSKYNIL